MRFYVLDFGNRREAYVSEGNHRVIIGKMLKSMNLGFNVFKNVDITLIKISENLLQIQKQILNEINVFEKILSIVPLEENRKDITLYVYDYFLKNENNSKLPFEKVYAPMQIFNGEPNKDLEKYLGLGFFLKKRLKTLIKALNNVPKRRFKIPRLF
jgi:hypothetical protein